MMNARMDEVLVFAAEVLGVPEGTLGPETAYDSQFPSAFSF